MSISLYKQENTETGQKTNKKKIPEEVQYVCSEAENRSRNLHINKKVNRSSFKFTA